MKKYLILVLIVFSLFGATSLAHAGGPMFFNGNGMFFGGGFANPQPAPAPMPNPNFVPFFPNPNAPFFNPFNPFVFVNPNAPFVPNFPFNPNFNPNFNPGPFAVPVPAPAPIPVPQAMIILTNNGFIPDFINLAVGTQVTFINKTHAMRMIKEDNGVFMSPMLAPGQVFVFTFNNPGKYFTSESLNPNTHGLIVVQ